MTETSLTTEALSIDSRAVRVPSSTYRLQFNAGFTFAEAGTVTGYLEQLGISDCYASPLFAARPGSTHGYDVCNCGELNPSIGSSEDFEHWSEALKARGMGLLLDVVPNHMGAHPLNPWWRDVLKNGLSSKYADWFDIDWHRPNGALRGKVLLPILEDHYWKVLESGKLRIVFEQGSLELQYHEHRLPLSPGSLSFLRDEVIARWNADGLSDGGNDFHVVQQLLANSMSGCEEENLETNETSERRERLAISEAAERLLQDLLKNFNGTVGQRESFNSLNVLLEQQNYRLGFWRIGNEELNYRRFFDVMELVALRMELPEVFEATHALVLGLLREGRITGLRVDHPDGLWNPKQYFERLQESFAGRDFGHPTEENLAGNAAIVGAAAPGLYVVAEKILSGSESLPAGWPVAGTTGYDFLNLLNGVFIDSSNLAAIDEIYREFVSDAPIFEDLVYAAKLRILKTSMRGDLRALTRLLRTIAAKTRYGVDFSLSELQCALAGIIAAFPVYRTYITEESDTPTREEETQARQAVELARVRSQLSDSDALAFIESLLLLQFPMDLDLGALRDCRQFVLKFQQLTGPVMAKGLEDTTFYNYNRFISLNEVGGAPDHFGTDLQTFHQQNQWRAEHWPHTLLATATHDTKRGEDLRARLNVLSELPEEWRLAVCKWRQLNACRKRIANRVEAPSANDEYFFYQTLVGAWVSEAETGSDSPAFRQRMSNYMLKSVREAKAHTSWTQPDEAYETALQDFIETVLTHTTENAFLDDFMLFQRKVAFFGLFNSLAQVVLKMTVPGVPDFYQGTELWDYSLVDPDNRRPVNYQVRKDLLADLQEKFGDDPSSAQSLIRTLLKNYHTGQIKLFVIWRILDLRRRNPELFAQGAYLSLEVSGQKQEHVCAFARTYNQTSIIALAARLVVGLTNGAQRGVLESDVWQDTALQIPNSKPGDQYRNVLTQQIVTIGSAGAGLSVPDVLGLLPVAVLERIR